MKSLEYDLQREFLVMPTNTFSTQPTLHFLGSSTGNLMPEVNDRLDFGSRPEAAAILAAYDTSVFMVHQVFLQPGYGQKPGMIGQCDDKPYAADRLVVVVVPLKGVEFSGQISKCLEFPQMRVYPPGTDGCEVHLFKNEPAGNPKPVPRFLDVVKGGGLGLSTRIVTLPGTTTAAA